MAGMGPAPKPRDQRARRNKPPTADLVLPSAGFEGPYPVWPGSSHPDKDFLFERLWDQLWRTPQAAAWDSMGPGMRYVVARYVLLSVEPSQPILAELRQLEDRLGLNPLAMRRLGWEVARDELADERDEAKPDRPSRYAGLQVAK